MANILVADDDAACRNLVCEVIKRAGHTPVEAANGKEALEVFGTNQISLSFVDVNMPEMDGFGYLEGVKQLDPYAIVVMMTGYPSAETIIQTIEEDGYTYIAKPLDINRITDLIEKGLEAREIRMKEKK